MLNDFDLSKLQQEVNDLHSVLVALSSVMPKITPFLLRRRDGLITQLVDRNDDVLRGRIQEIQSFLDMPDILEKQISYRNAEIQRAEDGTTQLTGLDAIKGDFLQ